MRHLIISITTILTLLFSITANAAEDKALLERLKSQYGYARYSSSYENDHDYYFVGQGYSQQNQGVCDGTGKLIIPCKYSDISLFEFDKSGYAGVTLNGKKGAVDKTGKLIIPCKFDNILHYQLSNPKYGGLCEVTIDSKKGAADKSGNIVIPCKFDDIYLFQLFDPKYGRLCEVKIDGKKGAADKSGNIVIPCKFDDLSLYQLFDPQYGGLCEVTIDSKKGAADKSGNIIIPCKFDDISLYQLSDPKYGRLCEVKIDGKKGAANKSGNIIIPCKFDDIYLFQLSDPKYGGLCTVEIDGKKGVVDKSGNIVIPCKFDEIDLWLLTYPDNNGTITASINGKKGVIDKTGKFITPCRFEQITLQHTEGVMIYQSGNKFGIKDFTGKDLTEPIYDNIEPFANGVAQVTLNGVTSLLTNPLKGTNLEVANSLTASVAVDKNIPVSKNKSTETFAFIVANEDYAKWDASYALNDGKVFRDYCEKRMGIPATNIKLYENATYGTFRSMMGKMRDIADVYDGDARIILYFAGLGTQADNEQFLLPVDASLTNIKATGIGVRQLLDELSAMNTAGTVIITDAAFNGRDRRGEPLGEHRGVAIKNTPQQPKGNTAWLTASSDARNALASENLNHGIFTYYLLDALQKSDAITFDSLAKSITDDVKKHTLKSDETQIPYTLKSDRFNGLNFKF